MPRRLPYFYTRDQLKAFMDIIKNPVHRALFTILFGTGCRISEIIGQEKRRCITCINFYRKAVQSVDRRRTPGIPSCELTSQPLPKPPTKHQCEKYEPLHPGLRLQEVDMEAGTIRIFGKGNVERIVGLSPKAQATLAEILAGKVRGITVNQQAGKIDFGVGIRRVEQLARFYAEKAGLPDLEKFGRWSPHKMRHTHLSRLTEAAQELGQVDATKLAQEQAGHTSLKTTEVYLHLATTNTTKKMLEKTDL
jgi:integrase